MSAVSGFLRLTIRQRAQGRCEYCLIHEEDLLFAHEPDHIIAAQHGGVTIAENSEGEPEPFREGSGRKELAEAIATSGNPLTARERQPGLGPVFWPGAGGDSE